MTFVVDSNFFIQAHRVYYPLDVFPGFWNKIIGLAEHGVIVSIDKVKNEIYKNEDALKQWCKTCLPGTFFKPTTDLAPHYGRVAAWAYSKSGQYTQGALDEFLDADEADAWLVAYVLPDLNKLTIVTHEVSSPGSKKRVMLPDVCIAHGAKYCDTVAMFRHLGESI